MNIKLLVAIIPIVLLMSACESDQCTQTVTYTKATAIYEDLDALRNIELNAPVQEIADPGKIYVAEDYLLIGEEGKGIHIIDNSVKSSPQALGFLNIPNNKEFFVDGQTLYAESNYDMVALDISDIHNVQLTSRANGFITTTHFNEAGLPLVGFHFEEVTETLPCDTPIRSEEVNFLDYQNELIPPSQVPSSYAGNSDGQAGTINRITTYEDVLYLISDTDLHVFDIASGISKVTTLDGYDTDMQTIYLEEDKLYIGKADGMTISDLSTPLRPRQISEFEHEETCDPVLPHGDVAYVTLRADGPCGGFRNLLDVVDVSNPNGNLNLLNQIEMHSPYGMAIDGNLLYVGEGRNGLKIFDITSTRNPIQLEWHQSMEAYDIIVHPSENIILLAGPDGIEIYDNNSSLTLLGSVRY